MCARLFSILIPFILLAGCSTNPPSIPPSPSPSGHVILTTPTSGTSLATITLQPAPTLTSTLTITRTQPPPGVTLASTQTQPLPSGHTLLAYESTSSPDKRLVLLDPSDGASWEFSFPPGAIFATPFLAGLSPDARYFVYYMGATVEMYGQLHAEPSDFEMRLVDLDTQQVIYSTLLLSPGYPQDLKPIVEATTDQYWMQETDHQVMLDDLYYTMQNTMLERIRAVAWSPDGSLLAFASQNPGPTSDLNFFDPLTGASWRASSEPRHVSGLTWAPDSSTIALETTLYFTQATRITTDLLSRAGTLLASVEHPYFYGWLGSHNILLYRFVDFNDPYYELTLMDVIDSSSTTLWAGSLVNFAISPDLASYLITSSQPNEIGQSPGLYLVWPGVADPHHLSESRFWKVAYWGSGLFDYAASAPLKGIFDEPQPGGTYGISSTGEMTLIDEGHWMLLPSPDGKFLAAYGPYRKYPGLRVFAADGQLLAAPAESVITCLVWDSASVSLAFQAGQDLFIWETGSEAAQKLATRLEPEQGYQECGFTWVNQQP